jgi:3'(2'), 5'-bisphosphate nucleotidase
MVNRESLQRLVSIVREAGSLIQDRWAETRVGLKNDTSPVTDADCAAHAFILMSLATWDPAIPVISEEGVLPPYETRRTWTRFWLIDPLDGTKEFLARRPEYTVNVALIEDGEPVMGAVYAPALDLLYAAARGLGAWKQEASGARERIYSVPPRPDTPLVVAESRSHPSDALEGFLKNFCIDRRVRAGSSIKFCWVAEGKAHLYPRFGPTMEWDTAAGDCVYRQSGSGGERWSPLKYNTPTLRHEQFVIGLPATT